MNLFRWFSSPAVDSEKDRRNFINVEIDAVGIGLASAAAPFLPVFLTYLGGSNFQISLLTSMPALTGFVLAIPLGNFLQTRKNIVPWFSAARLMVVLSYALTALMVFVVPPAYLVSTILAVWAFATLPQTVVAICFSVVMNAVAGPTRRFDLMSRRWAILGFTTSVSVMVIGSLLEKFTFPLNYQIAFLFLSLGGLVSFYFSSHIDIPDTEIAIRQTKEPFITKMKEYVALIRQQPAFISFVSKRLVYLAGVALAAPLFPIYYVRIIHAPDFWIGVINTSQTTVMVVGYFIWLQQSRTRGSRRVLLLTTLGLSLYPVLVGITHHLWLLAVLAGFAGIFQAGLDLVFFDELMKTVPAEYCATFVSFAQSLQYLSAIIAPGIGSLIADNVGVSAGLFIGASLRFAGFIMFASGHKYILTFLSPSRRMKAE